MSVVCVRGGGRLTIFLCSSPCSWRLMFEPIRSIPETAERDEQSGGILGSGTTHTSGEEVGQGCVMENRREEKRGIKRRAAQFFA
jgi:hypothetical protein